MSIWDLVHPADRDDSLRQIEQVIRGEISEGNPGAEEFLSFEARLEGRTAVDPRWRAIKEDSSEAPPKSISAPERFERAVSRCGASR